jgi:hypothetical protein
MSSELWSLPFWKWQSDRWTALRPSGTTIFSGLRRVNLLIDHSHSWTVDICPTNAIIRELSQRNLRSLSYWWNSGLLEDQGSPLSPDPDISILDFSLLTSLEIYDIGTTRAQKIISDILLLTRENLRVLKLGYTYPAWRMRSVPGYPGLDGPVEPRIEKHLPLGKRLKLHTLELVQCPDVDYQTWQKLFDFEALEDFSFVDLGSGRDVHPSLWLAFAGKPIRCKRLKTDYLGIHFLDFLKGFQGLEQLFILKELSFHIPSSIDLSGHFHSLRQLFLPIADRADSHLPDDLFRTIISGCSLLEELAVALPPIPQQADQVGFHPTE